MTTGINERIRNLGMIAAFYNRAGRMRNIPAERAIPMMLGIFTFILTRMLDGERGVTFEEILGHVNQFYTRRDETVEKDQVKELIMRMMYVDNKSGIPFDYYDFENEKKETIKYEFLKVEHSSSSDEGNMIALTKTGRDMLFQTREIYQELRITMDLLFIKEQFKRGAFSRAIRSAENLKTSVRDSLEAKNRLISEIRRAPWRVNTSSLAQSYDDVEQQFQKEREMFDEIIAMIRNTEEKGLESKNVESLVKLTELLNNSRLMHERLLSLHLSIIQEYLKFRNKSTLRLLFGEMAFKSDLIDPLFQVPARQITPEVLSFLPSPETREFFPYLSLLRNAIDQPRDKRQKIETVDPEAKREREKLENQYRRERVELLTFVLKRMKRQKTLRLSAVFDFHTPDDNLLAFVIGLHQISRVVFSKTRDSDVIRAVRNAEPGYKGIEIHSLDEEIEKRGYVFSEYVFSRF